MNLDPSPRIQDNPWVFVGTTVAAFAMGIVLLSRATDAGIVSYVALALLGMNLALLNLKHLNLSRRHSGLLSHVSSLEQLAKEAANETE